MKIKWTNNAPKQEGQYLCKFPSSNKVEICTVYLREPNHPAMNSYLAIAEWGHKNVNGGYHCSWSEKLEA